jgi:hypothetical protein
MSGYMPVDIGYLKTPAARTARKSEGNNFRVGRHCPGRVIIGRFGTQLGRRPLGDGRGQASGMGGGFGVAAPAQMPNPAERLRWREGCLRAGAMTATRRGQERAAVGVFSRRGAVSVTGKQRYDRQWHIVRPFIPRRGGPQAGGASAIRIKVGVRHERPNAQYVLSAVPEAKPVPSLGTQ